MQRRPSSIVEHGIRAFLLVLLELVFLAHLGMALAPGAIVPNRLATLDVQPDEIWLPIPPGKIALLQKTVPLESGPCDGISAGDRGPRAIYCEIQFLAEAGRYKRALKRLEELQELLPRLSDRFSLIEGDLRMELSPNERACAAYEEAIRSPLRSVAAKARVERVRCLLAINHPRAEKAFTELRWRYPRMPYGLSLQLVRAKALDAADDDRRAASLYRKIDINHPSTAQALEARDRLSALVQQGMEIRPLTTYERLVRLRQLVRWGPYDEARAEIAALREQPKRTLTLGDRTQVALLGARLARKEGRWADVRKLLNEANQRLASDEDERTRRREQAAALDTSSDGHNREQLGKIVRQLIGGRSLLRQPIGRVYRVIQVGSQANLTKEVNQAVDALIVRQNVPPALRFKAAIEASGVADDDRVAQLFARSAAAKNLEIPSRYHRARCLERLGRYDEAQEEYRQVLALDQGTTPFYAFWARQRLPIVAKATGYESGVPPNASETTTELGERSLLQSEVEHPSSGRSREEIAKMLRPLVEEHGEAFPWLGRALDLLELNLIDQAADELHATYLAWSDARGRKQIRTGLESLYRGTYAPRYQAVGATRRARRKVDSEDIELLAEISAAIGDYGLTVRFGGWHRADERPRAHEEEVLRAAERHNIDPDLLHAVMRVESVYNRRIISYAGAVGLMQIMPATGTFIAYQQGRNDFTVDELLEPATNIDYAAWYLASLIERFDGRIPLAVAAYNGGPHNVRLWLSQHSRRMPLETFLETIPFSQTHRYVRRVMTHYEAYKAQRGQHVEPMDLTLPPLRPDSVAF